MTTEALAPWARPVPWARGRHTARDLARMANDEPGFELVEGRLVQAMPSGGEHGAIGQSLGARLWLFVEEHTLGRVLAAETGFDLGPSGQRDTVLAPDVAFVRAARLPLPGSEAWKEYWPLAPDLVVEVASPTQHHPELAAKARRWLAAGTQLIWVIWPSTRAVDLWRPGAAEPMETLGLTDTLDGLDVLPSFRCPVALLFS